MAKSYITEQLVRNWSESIVEFSLAVVQLFYIIALLIVSIETAHSQGLVRRTLHMNGSEKNACNC